MGSLGRAPQREPLTTHGPAAAAPPTGGLSRTGAILLSGPQLLVLRRGQQQREPIRALRDQPRRGHGGHLPCAAPRRKAPDGRVHREKARGLPGDSTEPGHRSVSVPASGSSSLLLPHLLLPPAPIEPDPGPHFAENALFHRLRKLSRTTSATSQNSSHPPIFHAGNFAAPVHHAHHAHPPPRLVPLSPPEHHEDSEGKKRPKDPYLMTEEEIKIEGRDFSNPFWYPEHRKILRKSRKEDPGDKEDPEDEAESENQL